MPKDKRIDAYLAKLQPWQKAVVAKLRALAHKADSGIIETIKWRHPAYEHKGLVMVTPAHKEWVSAVLYKGSLIKDTAKLYAREGGHYKAGVIKLNDVNKINEKAVVSYLKQIVTLNLKKD